MNNISPKMVKLDAKVPQWMAESVALAGNILGISQAEIVRSALLSYLARTVPGAVPGAGPWYPPGPGTPPGTPPAHDPGNPRGVPGTPPGTGPRSPLKILREEEEKIKKIHSDPEEASTGGTREINTREKEDRINYSALTAELVAAINNISGTRLRPDDPRAQRALYQRMTGDGLAPDDIGAASLEDIQLAVEHCARHWPPRMLSLTAILEKPNFWTYVGQAKAPPTPARGAPQLDAAGIELLKHVIYADEEG